MTSLTGQATLDMHMSILGALLKGIKGTCLALIE